MTTLPPKLAEVNDAITDLYSEYYKGAGCCLHITTDDYNIEDASVDSCVKWATEKAAKGRDERGNTHDDCVALAKRLRALTLRERAVLFHMKWCPACEQYDAYDECVDCRGKLVPLPSPGDFYKDGHDRFTIAKVEAGIYTVGSAFLGTETFTETEFHQRFPADWEQP